MIQKIINIATFKGTLDYIVGKEDAHLLDSNLLADEDDTVSYTGELLQATQSISNRKHRGKHMILSWHVDEHISSDLKTQLARQYLEQMGYGECDHLIVEHHDTGHEHLHIIVSRVDRDGQLIKDNNERFKGRAILRQMEIDNDLVRTQLYANDKQYTRLAQEYSQRGERFHLGDLTDHINAFDDKTHNIHSFIEHLAHEGFTLKIAKKEHRFVFERDGFVITAGQFGRDINQNLAKIKQTIVNNDSELPFYHDAKALKQFINAKRREFVTEQTKQEKYTEAVENYSFTSLTQKEFKQFIQSDSDFLSIPQADKEAHLWRLRLYEMNDYRFNPVQLKMILNASKEDKELVTQKLFEFNRYRAGEQATYYMNKLYDYKKESTQQTLSIPDNIISHKDRHDITQAIRQKIVASQSEAERSLYFLATRMVCRELLNEKNTDNDLTKHPRLDEMVENKASEILEKREVFRERVEHFRVVANSIADKASTQRLKHFGNALNDRNEIEEDRERQEQEQQR